MSSIHNLSEDELVYIFGYFDFSEIMTQLIYVSHEWLECGATAVQQIKISVSYSTTDKTVLSLCYIIPNIESLDLSTSPDISSKSLEYLAEYHSNTLKCIDISFCQYFAFENISFFFKKCRNLEVISMDHMRISSETVNTISENCKNLKELRLFYAHCDDDSIYNLIKNNRNLEVLDLTQIPISNKTLQEFKNLKNLRVLILDETRLFKVGMIQEIISNCEKLELLSLKEINFPYYGYGFSSFLDQLPQKRRIKLKLEFF
eukprot:gene1170-10684_t